MLRAWYTNVWKNRKFMMQRVRVTSLHGRNHIRNYDYYYCNLWCFVTDQHLCPKERFSSLLQGNWMHWIVTKNNAILGPFESRQGAEEMMRVVKGGRFWYGSDPPTVERREDG